MYYPCVTSSFLSSAHIGHWSAMRTPLNKAPLAFLIPALILTQSLAPISAPAEERDYGRSMIVTPYGIVATSYVQASQAGARILEQGGSAIDAGIAANAVLGVMEPMMDGIGGDLFALYWEAKTAKLTGINASGPAPRGLTPEFLDKQAIKKMPRAGIHSVTVPGAIDGWAKMHRRFGKLPWKELFQAAIRYGEQGFPLTEMIREAWAVPEFAEVLQEQPESAHIFLPGGHPPAVGEV